jgi:hypothetical protein
MSFDAKVNPSTAHPTQDGHELIRGVKVTGATPYGQDSRPAAHPQQIGDAEGADDQLLR